MGRQRTYEVISTTDIVTIGELVRLTEMRYSTLKHYTEEGLLPFIPSEENLTRRFYRVESIQKLNQIKELRDQNKSIQEIKVILGVI